MRIFMLCIHACICEKKVKRGLKGERYEKNNSKNCDDCAFCCGNFHMMRATDPEKSAQMRSKRLEDLADDRMILSSCEGCLDAFRSEGRETCHLLELLFGKSKSRGWGNRFRTTIKTPIE